MKIANKCTGIITKIDQLTYDVYSIWVKEEGIVDLAKPGQFINVYCKDGSRLLPRPISICEINKTDKTIRLVYRVLGAGTQEFSTFRVGDKIEIMGPLGNGFNIEGKRALLIGGGIGIPPMLELAKQLKIEKSIVIGYRDELFLNEEFVDYGKVYITTEDGSVGTKGNVIDGIIANNIEADIIYACGPTPMLKGVKEYAKKHGISAQLSLEERMACGIGACLACVCKSTEVDSHTHVHNKRICKEGPVFYAQEVEL